MSVRRVEGLIFLLASVQVLTLQSTDEELPLCGTGLLGWAQRRAYYLPRPHNHVQSALPRRHQSHQRLRLQSEITCLLSSLFSVAVLSPRSCISALLDLTVSGHLVLGDPLLGGSTETHGPPLDLHPGCCFAHKASGKQLADCFPLTGGA